jgi:hypothetical protein
MVGEITAIVLSVVIFCVYGLACLISAFFTFSLATYRQIDALFNLEVFSTAKLTTIENNTYDLDVWLIRHHKMVGPVLIVASIVLMKWYSYLINEFIRG